MLIERKTYGAGYGIASMERDLFEEAQAARKLREGMAKPRTGDTVWYDGDKAKITDARPDTRYGGWKVELDVGGQKITVNPGLSLEFGSKNDQQTKRKRQTLLQALRGAVSKGGQGMPDSAFSVNPVGEAKPSTADQHQLRILKDTVKNPLKGKFLGGPSADEAEKTLRSKFGFTDAQISKLKESTGAGLASKIRRLMDEGTPGVAGEHPGKQPQPSPTDYKEKSIGEIASVIRKQWQSVNFAAKPYLDAMMGMDKIDDNYGADSGRYIVSYFLGNASKFKGPEAKAIKAELTRRVKSR